MSYINIFILFYLLGFLNLYAIDFNTLKKYAIENSKTLNISRLNIDISKSELEYINSQNFPTITIGISTERSKGLNEELEDNYYVGDNSVSSSSLYKTYSYLSLNYSVYDFGRLHYKKKAQKYNINTKENEYCLEYKNIIQKLLDIYYNTKLAQIKNEYLNLILKYSNELYKYYTRLNKIGNIQKTDVVTNAMQVANIYNDISENKKTLIEGFEKLSNISSFDFKENEKLESLLNPKENNEKKFEDTSIAKKYLNEIKSKKAELDLTQAEYYPQISFFGKYDYYGYDRNSFNNSFNEFKENSYKYGLNASWQIFNGFKTRAQKKKVSLELAQLNLKYQQAKIDFETEINTINKTKKFFSSIMQKNEKILNLSNKNLDMNRRLNNIGEVDKSIELNSIIKKLNAKLEYKQAKETASYKLIKKNIMLNGDKECIVR